MIRSFIALVGLLTAGSVSFAAGACDTQLQFTCVASYLSHESGMVVQKSVNASKFVDENADEPSLSNCAATVYLEQKQGEERSVVRVYASKDRNSDSLQVSAMPIHTEVRSVGGKDVTYGTYGDVTKAVSSVGVRTDLGDLSLAKTIVLNNESISQVNVTCIAK